MIPRHDVSLDPSIPLDAVFWIPDADEVGDGGIAYFHDVWALDDVSSEEAGLILEEERSIVEATDSAAANEDDFETILRAIESNDVDALPETLDAQAIALVTDEMTDEPRVGCLDVGVAGLAHALAACGFWPAASCRGHGWAPYPVVYFAADKPRVVTLQPLVEAAGCGFLIDVERPQLIVVAGQSILDMMSLAAAVLASQSSFSSQRPLAGPDSTSSSLDMS